jgi:hypothetical protein
MMRMTGRSVGWLSAMDVTIYGSAANMLPLPGGVLVRIAAMKAHGTAFRRGGTLIMFGALWGAAACLSLIDMAWTTMGRRCFHLHESRSFCPLRRFRGPF